MAQRDREKSRRAAARPGEAAAPDASPRLEARVKLLERERDALKSELEAARARIASLEESRRQAANRIDWVIDALHGLIDKDG